MIFPAQLQLKWFLSIFHNESSSIILSDFDFVHVGSSSHRGKRIKNRWRRQRHPGRISIHRLSSLGLIDTLNTRLWWFHLEQHLGFVCRWTLSLYEVWKDIKIKFLISSSLSYWSPSNWTSRNYRWSSQSSKSRRRLTYWN